MTPDEQDTSALPFSETAPEQAARRTASETAEKTEEHGSKPRPRRAALVYNPVKVDIEVLRASIEAAEATSDYEPTIWLETTVDDPGTEMARQAVDQGATVVLAAGGDGTVRAVAEGLRGSGLPLALLPRGTGNLLARNLELTLDSIDESVSTAFAGEDRDVDLGVVTLRRPDGSTEERAFVVMAGLGLDAQMIVNTDDDLKKKAGWLAYVKAIGQSLKGGRRIKLRFALDDHDPRIARVHTLLVGNCGSLPANILLLPDAAVDDGVLDIVALRPDGLAAWASIWFKIIVENKLLHRTEIGRKLTGGEDGTKKVHALRYLRGQRLRVEVAEPEEFELDGDAFGEVTGFEISVEPGGLTVRVP
ncbi:diacylglycerol/lipid kinase family protein [Propionibacteriaceae bacterium Y1685]